MGERPMDETMAGRLERVAPRARRFLAAPTGDCGRALESTGGCGPPGERDVAAIAGQLRRAQSDRPAAPGSGGDAVAQGVARDLVTRARQALETLQESKGDAALDADDAMALESVLRSRGRPALRVEGDSIEPIDDQKHPGSGMWRNFLDDFEANMLFAAAATGAVIVGEGSGESAGPWVQGTAWLVRSDLAVTNRHLLFPPPGGIRLAQRMLLQPTGARLRSDLDLLIDFAFDSGPSRSVRYAIDEVTFVAEEGDPVDVALLKVRPMDGRRPAPLALRTALLDEKHVYVVGHPGRMRQVAKEVRAVFGDPDERKRVSFGELMDPDALHPGELTYDASTIGGFSGGCVLGFRSREVAGLHHYGDPLSGNRAIAAATLAGHAAGGHILGEA
ncbi:MAG TPA: serine protease [Allosphingosinicella sp.]|nr:serine protease [Allosphingosinicella sp.]